MLRRLMVGLVLAGAMVSPLSAAGPETLPPFACAGPFAPDTDEAALIRQFGRANVVFRTVPAAEGEMVKATVLFPQDRSRRVEIIWLDEKKRRRPGDVLVYDPGPWRTPEGIGIGATLAEVERANGKPFTLSGFGWDYGGSVLDFEGGRLAPNKLANGNGCRLLLRFSPPGAYEGDVDGDREFRSDDAAMRAAKPVVYQMVLSYGGE